MTQTNQNAIYKVIHAVIMIFLLLWIIFLGFIKSCLYEFIQWSKVFWFHHFELKCKTLCTH